MKNFNTILAVLVILYGLFSSGCSSKTGAINEVYIPVKCPLQMPVKPQNDGSFKAHKELMIYFLECENIALKCTDTKVEQ